MQSKPSPVRFGRAAAPRPTRIALPRPSLPARDGNERRWGGLSWSLSLSLFAVPVALALLTLFAPRFAASPQVTIRVADRYTGLEIAGAEIILDNVAQTTSQDGSLLVQLPAERTSLTVRAPGYETTATTLTRDIPPDWQVALRPNTLRGTVTDGDSSLGIPGAAIIVSTAGGVVREATTDADGRFLVEGVPDGATVKIASADHGVFEEPLGQRTEIDVTMRPSFVTGEVRDAAGAPVAGAHIAAANGTAETITGPDGAFRLSGGTDVAEVSVSAPGFADRVVAVDDSRRLSVALEGEMIKAVYANLGVLSDPERWNRLLEIADTTEINAIVIDVKQDTIYYDTQVPFFRDIEGMVTPIFDPEDLLAELDARGIYSIARMVVFKDPIVAAGRPDLAVGDDVTGGLWLDMNGTPWVNAFEPELWEANAELGAELARLGFDEVQYDYIRFPSDGDLRTADFGTEYTEASRRAAITQAVALGGERVRAAGARFAIDLFPIIALLGDDQGIGQTLQDLTPLADYVCLMVYPSHYIEGNIPVDGHPNDFPGETVTYTLERSQEWVPGTMNKMRPWLQDFTYPLEGYSVYGPDEVRAQIDAAEAMGVSGWMLWNAAGEFEVPALEPE